MAKMEIKVEGKIDNKSKDFKKPKVKNIKDKTNGDGKVKKVDSKTKSPSAPEKNSTKAENKYEKLISKKRKITETDDSQTNDSVEVKKPRLSDNGKDSYKKDFKKPYGNKTGPSKFNKDQKNSFGSKNKGFDKNSKFNKSKDDAKNFKNKKDLKKDRRQKKMADNYEISVNMKKIWETLRRSETTEETKKKLCSTLFDQVKGRISQIAFAHDTCRVIECLVQYGNEKHREGIFDELKDQLVELSKSKYARFLIKKMLSYGTKEQKDFVIKAFMGHATKLIKHSFACQVIEILFNEYASFAQRNQMLMEFYDPTFALFNDQRYKSLSDVFTAQPFSKEKILSSLKELLTSCVNKTLLMFSIIHRVFLEYFQNCDNKDKLEMIDLLSEHLVHMIHTKDGANVAMQCIWHGSAKERKKIIKSMKSFFVKIALEEHGHLVLLAIFDSVDDTKFVSKAVLEELFRSIKDLFDNEYGRKVITYLVSPRDSKFFIKDYVKRLEAGDSSETVKKQADVKRKELFDYSKTHLKDYINKEINSLLFNGAGGILIPFILEKLEKDGDEIIKKIANIVLEKEYEQSEAADQKQHCIEDSTCHFIIKQILKKDSERKTSQTLTSAIISHENNKYIRSWIDCNRGCFTVVNLIEAGSDTDKKKLKILLKDTEKQLAKNEKMSGAKILVEKLKEIKV